MVLVVLVLVPVVVVVVVVVVVWALLVLLVLSRAAVPGYMVRDLLVPGRSTIWPDEVDRSILCCRLF